MNITPIEVLSAAEIHVRVWAPIKSKKKMKNPSMFVYLVIKLHHNHFGLWSKFWKWRRLLSYHNHHTSDLAPCSSFFQNSKTSKPIKVRHLSQREKLLIRLVTDSLQKYIGLMTLIDISSPFHATGKQNSLSYLYWVNVKSSSRIKEDNCCDCVMFKKPSKSMIKRWLLACIFFHPVHVTSLNAIGWI